MAENASSNARMDGLWRRCSRNRYRHATAKEGAALIAL
jgi:hypothetical protein